MCGLRRENATQTKATIYLRPFVAKNDRSSQMSCNNMQMNDIMNKNSKQRRLIYESFKFVYKGKEYFLLTGKTYKLTADELKKAKQTAKKQNKKLSQVIPYFCTQIACIKYNAGKKTDVKNCGRLVGVTYSNKKRTKFGRLNRVDIGLKDDSRIVIWKRRKSDSAVQVSTFAFDNKIKQKLVEKKNVSFTNKKLLQFKTCFTMKKNSDGKKVKIKRQYICVIDK